MIAWQETDVLVIGAGAAGWPAAVGAARAGVRVLLVEDDPMPGGAAVDQFVAMPDGGPRSGVVAEFLAALERRLALTDRPVDRWWYFWYLPSDILRVVHDLLSAEPNLQYRGSTPAVRLTLSGSRVTGALVRTPDHVERWIQAKAVIDATGTGALTEEAGGEARYGEDSREDFGEAIAPPARTAEVQLCTWMFISHRLPALQAASTSWVPRGLESGYGTPSRHDDPGAVRRGTGVYLHWGGKFRCPDTRDPAALAETQREALRQLTPCFEELRAHGYGVHLAPRIGVREQRRILGEYVITANDLVRGIIPEDSVLVTQRPIDIWKVGGRGMADYPEVKPYGIPYRALVPRRLEGLLVVGKHMSGTHLAMASYRVQCLLGQIGQAAGVAAALCAQRRTWPRRLDYRDLKPCLLDPPQHLVIRADPDGMAPPPDTRSCRPALPTSSGNGEGTLPFGVQPQRGHPEE